MELIYMKIIGKEFRCIEPVDGVMENDVQGGEYKVRQYTYIYIYDNKKAVSYISVISDDTAHNIFGKTPPEKRLIKLNNLKKLVETGAFSTTIKDYAVFNVNKIKLQRFNTETQIWELSFDGEILLHGDAIRGVFYNKGKQVTPLRVYYNLDKPLPDPLIPEEDDEIV